MMQTSLFLCLHPTTVQLVPQAVLRQLMIHGCLKMPLNKCKNRYSSQSSLQVTLNYRKSWLWLMPRTR